jgi:adenosylcobinamide kinase/adenosylcobinamide-phosphate guanylyltransferase
VKVLFTGGVKSGKSLQAEQYCLQKFAGPEGKPIYLATTELYDEGMKERIRVHQQQRGDNFQTVEEPLELTKVLSSLNLPVLVECMTMWLNNMLYHEKTEDEIFQEVDSLLSLPQDIVFVINEVGLGVIPNNTLARKFVDLSGKVSQRISHGSDEVYFCMAGQKIQAK